MASMARVLALLACAAVGSAFRAVEEHRHTLTADAKTPAPILSALRAVQGIVDKHVTALKKATELAEEKKQAKTLQIEEKERIVKDVHAKTAAIALKAKASRELLLKVDKATTAHAEKGKEHAEAVEKFGTISDDLEDLAKNITYKEQMLQQIVEKLKRQIAALRARMDVRLNDKELAEAEMNQLKDEAMSAGKFKTGAEQEQAQAEEAMQTAQKELRGMQTKLDTAIAAATVAETEESKATNLLEEAANRESEAKKTRMLLQKLRKAVKDYFTSLEEVEISMEGKAPEDLKSLPETKAAFESWNLMVSSFRELHAFDKEIYVKVKPAVSTISADSKEAIKLACDQGRKMSDDELEELCITGVWAHLEMKEITFPTD